MNKQTPFLLTLILFTACACVPGTDPGSDFLDEIYPPVFLSLSAESADTLKLTFDKTASFAVPPGITPAMEILEVQQEESCIILTLAGEQEPGKEYILHGTVQDDRGNRMQFLAPFYGFNSRVPGIILNEFTTQGSVTHPDIIELRVTADGNLAGLTLYEGTKRIFSRKFIFPPAEVSSGDYIVLHWKPQGISAEIDETERTDQSGGIDAFAESLDFWVPGGTGLSGNNGVLSLYTSPAGKLLDGLIYSNRTSLSDTAYLGFGSREMMEKALSLVEEGGWFVQGEKPTPQEAINPSGSTATRSICRWEERGDTGTAEDWYIVPTGQFSIGRKNSTEEYTP